MPKSGKVHASEGLSSSRPNERSPDFSVTCTVCKAMSPKDGSPPHTTLKASSPYYYNETENATKEDSEQFDKDLRKAILDPVEVVELGSRCLTCTSRTHASHRSSIVLTGLLLLCPLTAPLVRPKND